MKATPLFASASKGHVAVMRHLIDAKANVDFKDSGFTMLFVAAMGTLC